jgi:large subunit ribosomal protein L21
VYAVIRTGNKQYKVEPGVELLVEKLNDVEPGKNVELTDVLLYADGTELSVGTPQVPVTVHCLCVGHEKGPKLRTVKYRRRENYHRTYGHRQTYTRLVVQKFERKGN